MTDFASKHDMAAVPEDIARIKRQLAAFYRDVEAIDPPSDHYIQLYHGEAIRAALAKRDALWGAFGAALAMGEMPEDWTTKYRASVAHALCPLLNDAVNQ